MFIRKKTACILSLAVLLMAAIIPMASTTFAADQHGSGTYSYYHKKYSAQPESSIGATSLAGEWAKFTTVEGSTPEEQLQSIITFLDETYEQECERFVITEEIAQTEITNMAGPVYLYDNSELYRDLISGETVTVATEGNFNLLADEGQNTVCERYVFSLDKAARFTLNTQYTIQQGELALWIVSQDGKILYHHDATDAFDQAVTLDLDKGLYSIVLEYHTDNGIAEGIKSISGHI